VSDNAWRRLAAKLIVSSSVVDLMKLRLEPLSIPDVLLLQKDHHEDKRGYTIETYNRRAFAEIGIEVEFVQDLQSYSKSRGTVRGLHFQHRPFGQHKLVRVLAGRIFDVAVDIRPSSPTFGRCVFQEMSEPSAQLYIPQGFAHGFCTLEPNTIVAYKLSSFYSPSHDAGVRWDDPTIAVPWPVDIPTEISDRDRQLPFLDEIRRALV